ncbi:MAG: oligosaccharide flippase family protein [Chloroflexota bacterium]
MGTATQTQRAELSLLANFSWTVVGNLIYAASQWAILAALTKLGTSEMVGQFALGLAVTTPVIMFTNLSLRSIQATDAQNQYHFSAYLALRLITSTIAFFVILAIAMTVDYPWPVKAIILAIGLTKIVESVSDIFYGLLQQHEHMDRIAQSLILRGPLSLAVVLVGIYLTGSLFWSVLGMGIVWGLILLMWDIRSGTMVLQHLTSQNSLPWPRWRFNTLRQLVPFSLPLGVVMMLIALISNIPRYFLEQNLGTGALGIFAAIAYLQVAGTTIIVALGESAVPRLAKYHAAGDRAAYLALLLRLLGIGLLVGGGGVAIAWTMGEPLLALIYQPEYAQKELFVWLMLAGGVSYIASFLGYGMTAARHFRIQLPLFAAVAATTTVACWWLIPTHGLIGAAMALLLASGVQVCISVLVILWIQHSLTANRLSRAVAA